MHDELLDKQADGGAGICGGVDRSRVVGSQTGLGVMVGTDRMGGRELGLSLRYGVWALGMAYRTGVKCLSVCLCM